MACDLYNLIETPDGANGVWPEIGVVGGVWALLVASRSRE